MRQFRSLVLLFLFMAPVAALSALSIDDLPGTSKWYFHADFKQMRSSDAGRHLYAWMQDEIFDEIREEAGFDIDKEADYLTAFATEDDGMVIVIEGNIRRETEDKVVAMGAATGSLNRHGSGKKAFYHIKDDDIEINGDDIDIDIDADSFDNGAYFSFALENKLIVTSTREKMEQLLDSKGKIEGVRSERGQLFVLNAERGLIQAGASTSQFDGDGDWDSNILRLSLIHI